MSSALVQDFINQGSIKKISDDILQGIEKIENAPDYERRRWIWELMQNAKDVDNRFGGVSIEIELRDNLLLYRHNGDPFEIKHLTSLVQQVSSKDDSDTESDTTGKFGTGFITTHMLSRLIRVKGIVRSGIGHQRFELGIDRRGTNSQEMSRLLGDSLAHVLKLDNTEIFPLQEKYESTRQESHFDTVFEYPLNERGLSIARIGINDLELALPYTMLFVPKLKAVRIVDTTSGSDIHFSRGLSEAFGNLIVYQILREDVNAGTIEGIYITVLEQSGITMARRVDTEGGTAIRKNGAELPKVFKDFPLVGTGGFYLPVALNSHRFMPAEPRDGIYLKNEGNPKVEINRGLLEHALPLIQEFIQSAILEGFNNLHYLALSALPENNRDYICLDWYRDAIQKPLRQFLLSQQLVVTEDERLSLRDARFPVYKDNEAKTAEFFDISAELKWCIFPKKQYHWEWLEIIRPQYESWQTNLKYTIENLLEDISQIGQLPALQEALKNSVSTDWLNKIIDFLIREELTNHLERYAIVPNQNGQFIKLQELYYDNAIPEELKEVLQHLGTDWKNQLICTKIRRIDRHPSLGVGDISKAINALLTKIPEVGNSALERELGLFKLVSILTSEASEIRKTLFSFAKTLFPESLPEQYTIVPGTSDFNWDPINKWLVEKILAQVQEYENVEGLANGIDRSESDTLYFLNELICFIFNNSNFKSLLDSFQCIPCQYGDFRYLKDLSNDVDSTPDDLKEILHTLDNRADWKADLLHLAIVIDTSRKKTLSDLCTSIDDTVREHDKHDGLNADPDVKRMVLRLLSRFRDGTIAYEDHFRWLYSSKASVQVQLMEQYQREINLILENESILPQLASIVESGWTAQQLDNLQTLVGSGLSMDQLHGLLASVDEIGIERALDSVNRQVEEQRDFKFKEQIGTYVEEAFQAALRSTGLIVQREPIGQDFVITKPGSMRKYRIEIKSIGQNSDSVLISSVQGRTAVFHSDAYALCVIRRAGQLFTSEQDFIAQARFVHQIGSLLREKVTLADEWEQRTRPAESAIELSFDNRTYKYRVRESIWADGLDFNSFVNWISTDFFG